MLTHRHKKPFECKADGCGKSYCDARSLRRHTENHHVHPSLPISTPTISVQEVISNTSNIPTCIHYAPKGTQSFQKNNSSSAKLPKTTVSVEKSIVLKASNQVQSKQTASSGDASVSDTQYFFIRMYTWAILSYSRDLRRNFQFGKRVVLKLVIFGTC